MQRCMRVESLLSQRMRLCVYQARRALPTGGRFFLFLSKPCNISSAKALPTYRQASTPKSKLMITGISAHLTEEPLTKMWYSPMPYCMTSAARLFLLFYWHIFFTLYFGVLRPSSPTGRLCRRDKATICGCKYRKNQIKTVTLQRVCASPCGKGRASKKGKNKNNIDNDNRTANRHGCPSGSQDSLRSGRTRENGAAPEDQARV